MDRLGSHEGRRHHDLVAQDEVVDDQMMAVELPAPRAGVGWLAHHGEVVQALAVLIEPLGHLGDGFVEAHDVARLLESLGAQRRLKERKRPRPLRFGHLLEAHALPRIAVDVVPLAPFEVIDRECRLRSLLGRERGQECNRRGPHGRRRDPGRADRKESGRHGPVRRHPLEGFVERVGLLRRPLRRHDRDDWHGRNPERDPEVPADSHAVSFRLQAEATVVRGQPIVRPDGCHNLAISCCGFVTERERLPASACCWPSSTPGRSRPIPRRSRVTNTPTLS